MPSPAAIEEYLRLKDGIPFTPKGSPIEFHLDPDGLFGMITAFEGIGIDLMRAQNDKQATMTAIMNGLSDRGKGFLEDIVQPLVINPELTDTIEEARAKGTICKSEVTTSHLLQILNRYMAELQGAGELAKTFREIRDREGHGVGSEGLPGTPSVEVPRSEPDPVG